MSIRSKSIKGKVYKFSLKEDEYIKTTIFGERYSSENGFISLDESGVLRINGSCDTGYSWDGCTPKWEVLDFTIGTPDGRFDYLTEKPITYYASLFHDAIYQHKEEIPISRRDADMIFYKILKESGFIWSAVYFFFVRLFGGIFGTWKSKKKTKNMRIVQSSWVQKSYQAAKKLNPIFIQKHPFMTIAPEYDKS